MKKLIILCIALLPIISNCKKDNDIDSMMRIREIAWNSLSEVDKAAIVIDWKQAPVTESTYNGKSAYVVRFNTADDALIGPITIYIDISTNVVLSQTLRD